MNKLTPAQIKFSLGAIQNGFTVRIDSEGMVEAIKTTKFKGRMKLHCTPFDYNWKDGDVKEARVVFYIAGTFESDHRASTFDWKITEKII